MAILRPFQASYHHYKDASEVHSVRSDIGAARGTTCAQPVLHQGGFFCVASLMFSVTHASIENASSPGDPFALFLLQCVTDDATSSQLTAHPTHCLLSFLDWVAGLHCDVALTGAMTSCLLREL